MKDDTYGLYIRDTKTTGGNMTGTALEYTYNPQPVLYIYALRQNDVDVLGWRTDVVYSKILKARTDAQVMRSDFVCPSDTLIVDVINSYAVLTDRIRDSLEDDGPISYAFPRNPNNCFRYYKPCPFYNICHDIDIINEPTIGFSLDPWLKEGTVLNTFKIGG